MNDNMERITADRLRIVVDNDKPTSEEQPAKSSRKPKSKPKRRRFAQIPLEWLNDPYFRRRISPEIRLYLAVQYATKRGARAVRLTNGMAATVGLSRQHKAHYLRKLEAQGLIQITHRGNRNPEILLIG